MGTAADDSTHKFPKRTLSDVKYLYLKLRQLILMRIEGKLTQEGR